MSRRKCRRGRRRQGRQGWQRMAKDGRGGKDAADKGAGKGAGRYSKCCNMCLQRVADTGCSRKQNSQNISAASSKPYWAPKEKVKKSQPHSQPNRSPLPTTRLLAQTKEMPCRCILDRIMSSLWCRGPTLACLTGQQSVVLRATKEMALHAGQTGLIHLFGAAPRRHAR